MSSQPRPTTEHHGRSTKMIILELILLVGIPTIVIFLISRIWK